MDKKTIEHNLKRLKEEHKSLDLSIDKALDNPKCDMIAVQRMKKRKLQIKDEVETLKHKLERLENQTPEQIEFKSRLKLLREEHRTLDHQIEELTASPIYDQLAVQQMKKKKLYLKEEILKIESMLVPDTLA